MDTMTKIGILLAASISFTICQGLANDGIPLAYDATFNETLPKGGSTTIHQMSDGKGHMRMEFGTGTEKTISIWDYPNKVMYTLLGSQHKYLKGPIRASKQVMDEESAKKLNGTPIGTKTIDGHPCHGWDIKIAGMDSQVWIGDDIHLSVYAESTMPMGKSVRKLQSYSGSAPPGDLTAIPAGYTELSLPGMQ